MQHLDRLIRNNKAIQNAGWIIGEQIFQMIISLVVGILSARYLGPSNYGTLNYTASFVNFFLSIATLGMEGVVVKKLISHPDQEGVYLGSCMVFRLVASCLSAASIFLIVVALNPDDHLKWGLVSLQSMQLLFKSVYILDSWFQRHLKSKYVSIGKIIACIIVSTYKILLLVTSKSVVWFAISNSLTDCVVGVVLLLFYKKEKAQRLSFSFAAAAEIGRF